MIPNNYLVLFRAELAVVWSASISSYQEESIGAHMPSQLVIHCDK